MTTAEHLFEKVKEYFHRPALTKDQPNDFRRYLHQIGRHQRTLTLLRPAATFAAAAFSMRLPSDANAAVFPIILVRHYGGDASTAVRVALTTSTVSLLTMPL